MGYETRYSLKINPQQKMDNNLLLLKCKIIYDLLKSNKDADYCLDENGETNDSGKWYEHEKDFKEFSKKYPEIIFLLEGSGEENDDIWKKYFKDGKMQECRVILTFDEFDEKKLS